MAPLGCKLLSFFRVSGTPQATKSYIVLTRNYRTVTSFTNMFGERKGRMMIQVTTGSLRGISEVVLLPPTNHLTYSSSSGKSTPDAFRGRGVVRTFMEEGTTLYRGLCWTVACNVP